MSSFEELIEAIRQNTQIVIETLQDNDAPLDFGIGSLKWLENYIEPRRSALTEHEKDNLVATVGSFLGECLCRSYEGEWVEMDGRLGVRVRGGSTAFPFSRVTKFMNKAPFDSFVSLYRAIPAIIEHFQQQKDSDSQ